MRTQIFALALFGSLVGGCGGGGDDTPTNQLQFCEERAKRECANVVPACLMPELDCMSNRQKACNNQAAMEVSAQRAFVPANAATCLATVSEVFDKLAGGTVAITPDEWRKYEADCARVFQGAAQANQRCNQNADCSGSLICDRGYCGTKKKVNPGEGCANTGEYCAPGNYCSDETGRELCTVRIGYGGACSDTVPCLENLRCDRADHICTTLLTWSAVCEADSDCETGFCEPYARKCSDDVRFASGTPACENFASTVPTRGGSIADAAAN
jgi:hypothetical protein